MNNEQQDADEAQKYLDVCKEIEGTKLRQFLEWICEPQVLGLREYLLCARQRFDPQPTENPHWNTWDPAGSPEQIGEKLLAAFFEIDLAAVERHRTRLFEAMARAYR